MAKKKAKKQANSGGVAKAAPSAVSDEVNESLGTTPRMATGEAAAEMMAMAGIAPPPDEVFAGLAPGPQMVRRGGRLVPMTPPQAGYQPGKPFGAGPVDFTGAYPDTAKARRTFSRTFAEPTQELTEARQRAQGLRMVLGQCLQLLEHGYHEAMGAIAWLKDKPQAVAEFAREGIDLAEVKKFADEADDVLALFTVTNDVCPGCQSTETRPVTGPETLPYREAHGAVFGRVCECTACGMKFHVAKEAP